MKKSICSKIIALTIIGLISVNSYTFTECRKSQISAAPSEDEIEQLEILKDANEKKITELKEKIEAAQLQFDAVSEDENAKIEYQNTLNDKIRLQNENIQLVRDQMDKLDEEIAENTDALNVLAEEIIQKNNDIDNNFELFKKRLRASYMSGNDTLAAVFTGSADFYDMLAKLELVSKVAEHDDDLIKNLKKQLEELESLNAQFEQKRSELLNDYSAAEQKKDEFREKLDDLNSDYQETLAELQRLSDEKDEISGEIYDMHAEEEEIKAEREKINADIAAIQEAIRLEAQRKAEEEARRKAEEEERLRQEEEEKRRQEESSRPDPVVPSVPVPSYGYAWPVPGYYGLTSNYGYRSFDDSFHEGIDISEGGIMGAAVVAAESGTITRAIGGCTHNYPKNGSCGCGGGYGNYVIITHDDGTYSTLYGHMRTIYVSTGQRVSKGQQIGEVGTTGYSTGAHLHFEVMKGGSTCNPMSFY